MKLVFLAFVVLFQQLLQGQDYFSRYYTFDSGVSNFRTLLVDRDTILLEGIFVDTIDPFLQGIAFAKVDSSGNLISYQRYFDPHGRDLTYPPLNNLIKTSDGGYLTVAMTFQDDALLLIFLNSEFRVDTVFEYLANDQSVKVNYLRSVFELNDGYMIFGSAQRLSFASDGQAFRIRKNGELVWRKWYGMPNKDEFIGDVSWYSDSTFVISSFHKPFPVSGQNKLSNTWIFQIDLNGNILNNFVDPDMYSGTSGGLVIDKNNNIYYTGTAIIEDMYGQHNGLGRMGMLNDSFNLQWKTTYGKNHNIIAGFADMILSRTRLISVGTHVDTSRTSSGFLNDYTAGWTALANIYGDSICERFDTATWYPKQSTTWGKFRSLDTLSSGNIIACGEGRFGPEDDHHEYAWLVKMPNPPCENVVTNSKDIFSNETSEFHISPNPAINKAVFRWNEKFTNDADHILMFDIDGKFVKNIRTQDGINEIAINLSGLIPCTYIVLLISKGGYLLGLEKLIVSP